MGRQAAERLAHQMPDERQMLADQILELPAFQLDLERGTLKGRCHRFPLVSGWTPCRRSTC
ncbi:hypothetical protein GCM10020218_069290 [Dactylosporangium vinaceum]